MANESTLRHSPQVTHWTPSTLRTDTGQPLIQPARTIGLWRPPHLQVVPLHDHAFFELGIVIEGSGFHFGPGHEEPIRPGMAVFVPPGIPHGFRAQQHVLVQNCFIRAELAEFELLWASQDDALGAFFGRVGAGRPGSDIVLQLDPATMAAALAELAAIDGPEGKGSSRAGEIGHLLVALDLMARNGVLVTTPARSSSRPSLPYRVSAAMGVIERDLTRHWTLTELGHEVYVGPYYLAHEFKRWVGVAPLAYANWLRAERAAVLLSTTDNSMVAVGQAVGWPDAATLSRSFRKAFGQSPRTYRQHARASASASRSR